MSKCLELAGALEAYPPAPGTIILTPDGVAVQGTEKASVFGGIDIEFRDGLPRDEREESEITERDIRAGILSKRSAMIRRFDMTQTQADNELIQIRDEANEAIQRQQEATGFTAMNRVMERRNGGGGEPSNATEEGQQTEREPNPRIGQA